VRITSYAEAGALDVHQGRHCVPSKEPAAAQGLPGKDLQQADL
jgi:hypothetical protein